MMAFPAAVLVIDLVYGSQMQTWRQTDQISEFIDKRGNLVWGQEQGDERMDQRVKEFRQVVAGRRICEI